MRRGRAATTFFGKVLPPGITAPHARARLPLGVELRPLTNSLRSAGRCWICDCRGCVLVAAGYVPALMRMRTRVRRSQATERRVGVARLRAGPTGRRGRSGRCSRDCIPGWWSWPDRPESQGGVGGVAHANPGTSIACNRAARGRGEARSWPYRPKGTIGPVSRDCIPGWWSWPYRPQSQSGRWGHLEFVRIMR
jgi:hypothetical protein